MLICVASASPQQKAAAGRGWGPGGGDRQWHRLLPGSACLAAPSGWGGQGDRQEAPLKVSDPSRAFSQHEENALSLLQVALTFLAEAGK